MTDSMRIGVLYPDLLNIYADRGNLLYMQRRCEWRGIGFSVVELGLGEKLDPGSVDMLYIGGGQDRDQALCADDLIETKRDAVIECDSAGMPILAVCGGYQLLGRSYATEDGEIPGLGIAPLSTVREPGPRLIGPCAIRTDLGGPTGGVLAGFENHGGRTELDSQSDALGSVLSGHGNNGRDRLEGFRRGNLIGTYLHGPLLPKNWWFADHLLAASLGRHPDELAELDSTAEIAAHREALGATGLTGDTFGSAIDE